ncbi:anhydro-N-acetylmuramic acid kinase [Nesterenkonia muleiensis]|uniref:anhydro-N-acetylmuramic acid kinase n=1 Tax=Nesterenkonia muleiensis TaxID=2282648 RepID=UPI000E76DA7C|nr:anhydro-N-acetylmuramic acid kinase [Nesterenkonia muleiensis]
MSSSKMRILGLISGTSHDGIDGAVVDFTCGSEVLDIDIISRSATPYLPQLRAKLLKALPPEPTSLATVAELDTQIGQAFAQASADALESAWVSAESVDLIVSHGQTVYHWVAESPNSTQVLGTLQIGQPAWIAERTGAPVLSDVRIRDIAAGGQGAPLASTLDALLLAGRPGTAAALNLGGISNVTVVGKQPVRAWDIGPANALIDAVVADRDLHPAGYDDAGAIAATGRVCQPLLELMLEEKYYRQPAPKSTGKELFHIGYVNQALQRHADEGGDPLSDADLVATLTELTVRTVVDALSAEGADELFVSGGGVHNQVMMDGLIRGLPDTSVRSIDALGIGPDEKEAVLMALIGWLSLHGLAGAATTATGARSPRILGSITPGGGPLRIPEPLPSPPSAARVASVHPDLATVTVRAADLTDLDAAVEVFLSCWHTSYQAVLPRHLVERMDPNQARELWSVGLADTTTETLVAEHDGAVVGVVRYGTQDRGNGHVRSLYVDPAAQGGGYGRKLLQEATDALRSSGADEISLWVFESNTPSRRFYERQGWIPDGQRSVDPRYGEPQIRLVRSLP